MAFAPVVPLSFVPQSPVQLALDAAVVVAPTFTLPPVLARTVSVHCGVGSGVAVGVGVGVALAVKVAVTVVSASSVTSSGFFVCRVSAEPLTPPPLVETVQWLNSWSSSAVAMSVTVVPWS